MYNGQVRWDFNMIFSKDWNKIKSGEVLRTYNNGTKSKEKYRKNEHTKYVSITWDYFSGVQTFV